MTVKIRGSMHSGWGQMSLRLLRDVRRAGNEQANPSSRALVTAALQAEGASSQSGFQSCLVNTQRPEVSL